MAQWTVAFISLLLLIVFISVKLKFENLEGEIYKQEEINKPSVELKSYNLKNSNDVTKRIIKKDHIKQKEITYSYDFKNEYMDELEESLKRRKILYLIHFTNIKNLSNILKKGLLPVNTLRSLDVKYFPSDPNRYDKMTDCVNLSIEYPNYKYFYSKWHNDKNNNYCVLVIDAPKLLLSTLNYKYYTSDNAAKREYRDKIMKQWKIKDFEQLFYGKDDYLPANVQAEILYQGSISPTLIKEIHFQKDEHKRDFINQIDKDLYIKYQNYFVTSDFYFNKRDFVKWEKR